MKKFLLLTVCIIHIQTIFSQSNSKYSVAEDNSSKIDYLLIEGKDTLFCFATSIRYNFFNAKIKKFEYLDNNGKAVKMPENELDAIKALKIGRFAFEKTPANIPERKVKQYKYLYDQPLIVKTNGRIEILTDNKVKLLGSGSYLRIKLKNKTERKVWLITRLNSVIDVVKFEDGTYVHVNRKDYKEIILPRLKKCEAFKNAFEERIKSGDVFYKNGNFRDVSWHVGLYNEVCR